MATGLLLVSTVPVQWSCSAARGCQPRAVPTAGEPEGQEASVDSAGVGWSAVPLGRLCTSVLTAAGTAGGLSWLAEQ